MGSPLGTVFAEVSIRIYVDDFHLLGVWCYGAYMHRLKDV